jgi:hypothetical protein
MLAMQYKSLGKHKVYVSTYNYDNFGPLNNNIFEIIFYSELNFSSYRKFHESLGKQYRMILLRFFHLLHMLLPSKGVFDLQHLVKLGVKYPTWTNFKVGVMVQIPSLQ